MKNIFVINGSGGVGKDTFVSLVRCGKLNYSSITYIKSVAEKLGWTGGKSEKDRKFLADLKSLVTEYSDIPFKKMCEFIDTAPDNTFIFLHIREPKEIERIVERYDAKTILVTRAEVKHITSNKADGDVFNYSYDTIIKNDGSLEDLQSLADDFLEDVLDGRDLKPLYFIEPDLGNTKFDFDNNT